MKRVFGIVAALLILTVVAIAALYVRLSQPLSDQWQLHDDELSLVQMDSVITKLQGQILPAEVYASKDLPGWLVNRLLVVHINGEPDEDSDSDALLVKYTELLAAVHSIGGWEQTPGWYRQSYLAGPEPMVVDYLNLCRLWFKRAVALQWQLTPLEQQMLAAVVAASTIGPDACQSQQDVLAVYRGAHKQQDSTDWLAPAALRHLWLRQLDGGYSSAEPLVQRLSTVSDVIRLLAAGEPAEQLASARVLGLLMPPEALPALRFQLITQPSETLQLAIVSALSGYGSALRPYLPQLKLLQRQTSSDALKSGIQRLIQKTNGQ
jgi:hypothetical protein